MESHRFGKSCSFRKEATNFGVGKTPWKEKKAKNSFDLYKRKRNLGKVSALELWSFQVEVNCELAELPRIPHKFSIMCLSSECHHFWSYFEIGFLKIGFRVGRKLQNPQLFWWFQLSSYDAQFNHDLSMKLDQMELFLLNVHCQLLLVFDEFLFKSPKWPIRTPKVPLSLSPLAIKTRIQRNFCLFYLFSC